MVVAPTVICNELVLVTVPVVLPIDVTLIDSPPDPVKLPAGIVRLCKVKVPIPGAVAGV